MKTLHPRSRAYKAEPPEWNIHDTNAKHLLKIFHQKIKEQKYGDLQPAVIFDLDGTLFDVSHRTLGILREWLETDAARKITPSIRDKIAQIDLEHVGYSLFHAFENAGLDLRSAEVVAAFTRAEVFWQRRFFDGEALVTYDQVVPGAPEFVNACEAAGLHICYLTGRSGKSKKMREGTTEKLHQAGFPTATSTFRLKPSSDLEDHTFKEQEFVKLAQEFAVLGNFENEYINIRGMALRGGNTTHVVVDTQHSGRDTGPLMQPIHRITDFSEVLFLASD